MDTLSLSIRSVRPLRRVSAGGFTLQSSGWTADHLTNRWSQPLAVVISWFDFMKQFSMFATVAAASGGSAPSR